MPAGQQSKLMPDPPTAISTYTAVSRAQTRPHIAMNPDFMPDIIKVRATPDQ